MANPILQAARKVDVAPEDDKLKTVQDALAASTARTVQSITDLTAAQKQTATATDVIVSSIQDITSARLTIAATVDNADLQAQNATISAFEVAGGTDAQVLLMQELADDNKAVDEILDTRAELADEDRFGEGIGLIDSVINQFNINLTNQQLLAAENKLGHTERQIRNTSTATESFARVNALTKKTLNAGTIEANYKAIEAEGALKVAQAELTNMHSNATAMNQIMAADTKSVSNLIQGFRLEGEAQQREVTKERIKFQREQMEQTREKWKLQAPADKIALEQARLNLERSKSLAPVQQAKAEQELASSEKRFADQIATEKSLVTSVQRAQSLAGVPVEDSPTIIFGLNQTGEAGRKYGRLLEIGGVQDAVLGSTPYEAMTSVQTISPSGNVRTSKGTRLLSDIAGLQAAKYSKLGAGVPRDKAAQQTDFNTTAREHISVLVSNIATGDNSNPYHAPPFTILEETTDLQLQPLYTKILKPMQLKETNPQTITDAAVAGVLAGTISVEEAAAGIESIFDLAALVNNTQDGGFRRVGLPNQTTYNSKINMPDSGISKLLGPVAASVITAASPLGGEVLDFLRPDSVLDVDLMDRAKINAMLIKALSNTGKTVSPKKGDK